MVTTAVVTETVAATETETTVLVAAMTTVGVVAMVTKAVVAAMATKEVVAMVTEAAAVTKATKEAVAMVTEAAAVTKATKEAVATVGVATVEEIEAGVTASRVVTGARARGRTRVTRGERTSVTRRGEDISGHSTTVTALGVAVRGGGGDRDTAVTTRLVHVYVKRLYQYVTVRVQYSGHWAIYVQLYKHNRHAIAVN